MRILAIATVAGICGALACMVSMRCPQPLGLPQPVVQAFAQYSEARSRKLPYNGPYSNVFDNIEGTRWQENYLRWFETRDSNERLLICGITLSQQTDERWDWQFHMFDDIYSEPEAEWRRKEVAEVLRNREWFRWHWRRCGE